jgi:hypothetical protein
MPIKPESNPAKIKGGSKPAPKPKKPGVKGAQIWSAGAAGTAVWLGKEFKDAYDRANSIKKKKK